VAGKGYRHVGVDLRRRAADGRRHGVRPVNGDVTALPLADRRGRRGGGRRDPRARHRPAGTVAELCRVLRPGGLLVLDTVNDNALSRFVTVTAGERLGFAPRGCTIRRCSCDRAG
jgi:2-polyprenyl-6-hydroxyphenyl methylase/3-demethylubiquinone-9 3-methyltransferase